MVLMTSTMRLATPTPAIAAAPSLPTQMMSMVGPYGVEN